ncbi:hypothetical protein RHODOP_04191 [Rhodoplanes sp. P11]
MSDAPSATSPSAPPPAGSGAQTSIDAAYAAICDAMMETQRGRWFLDEHTRRARLTEAEALAAALGRVEDRLAALPETLPAAPAPADRTDELLDALARIEATVADRPEPPAVDLAPIADTLARIEAAVSERPAPPPAIDSDAIATALARIEAAIAEQPEPPAVDLAPVTDTLGRIEAAVTARPQPPAVDPEAVAAALARIEAAIAEQPAPAVGPEDLAPLARIEETLGALRAVSPPTGWTDDLVAALGRIEANLAEERAPPALTGLLEDLVAALARIEAVLMREPDSQEAAATARDALMAAVTRLDARLAAEMAALREASDIAALRTDLASLSGAVERVGGTVTALTAAPPVDGRDETAVQRLHARMDEQAQRLDLLIDVWARTQPATTPAPAEEPAPEATPAAPAAEAATEIIEPEIIAQTAAPEIDRDTAEGEQDEPHQDETPRDEAHQDEPHRDEAPRDEARSPSLDQLLDSVRAVLADDPAPAASAPVTRADGSTADPSETVTDLDSLLDAVRAVLADDPDPAGTALAAAPAAPPADDPAAAASDDLAGPAAADTTDAVATAERAILDTTEAAAAALAAIGVAMAAVEPADADAVVDDGVVAVVDDHDEADDDLFAAPSETSMDAPAEMMADAASPAAMPAMPLVPIGEVFALPESEPEAETAQASDEAPDEMPNEAPASAAPPAEDAGEPPASAEPPVPAMAEAETSTDGGVPDDEEAVAIEVAPDTGDPAPAIPVVEFDFTAPPVPAWLVGDDAEAREAAAEIAQATAQATEQEAVARGYAPDTHEPDAHDTTEPDSDRPDASALADGPTSTVSSLDEIEQRIAARLHPDPVSAYRFSIGDVPPAAPGFDAGSLAAALSGSGWAMLSRIAAAEVAKADEAPEPPPVHTVPIDPLAPLKGLTEEEKIALFS